MEMDKRYDHQTFDKEIKAFWDEKGIYNFTPDSTKELFSVDTPPPTVSGTLHIGHIFSYTHTDIIVRYKRMRGFNVFYPMGFDDNGLPTERFVEKKNSTKAHLMKRSEFIKLCLKESHEVEQTFADLWKTIGLSVDWAMTYSTISDDARSIAQTSFIDLYNKGFIYRKEEPALYCTTCQTTVAQAELDSVELPSTFNDVQFKTESGETFTIATTRPELLPACVAMVYHPSDKRYQKFAGQYAITPIFGKRVPFIADDKIDPEKGTGIVMCCTFGDPTDIYWFKQYKLPFIQIISRNGLWTENTGILQGLRVHEARKKVLEALAECGALLKQEKINHNVPVHERCKQGIEYLILSQWFVEILKHKQDFIKLAEKINWHPAYMRARYNDWVEHLNWDWCISRQRYFGIPFPVWHCGDCSKVVFADKAMLPVDPQETPYGKPCSHCGGANLTPDTDVMDTWNTSSLTPQLVSRWSLGEQRVPMPLSMRPQAHDIIRTWAFYTIIKAFYHNNDIPWKDIVISGHVLAGKEKISKSKGNEKMTPQDLLAEHSADVIRFWTASGKLGMDTAFSDNQLKIGSKLVTKLWNALRFTSEFLGEGYVPAAPATTKNLVNQWLLSRRDQTIASYCEQFNKFEYTDALDRVEKFFWHDFCDNYLELIKDQMQNSGKYSAAEIAETKYTIHTVGYSLLQLYAPFIPFVTEKLYQLLYKKYVGTESLHTTILSQSCFEQPGDQIEKDMHLLLAAIGHVRKLKSEAQCSLKTPIKTLVIHGSTEHFTLLRQQERMLLGITQSAELVAGDGSRAQNALEGQEPELVAHIVVG